MSTLLCIFCYNIPSLGRIWFFTILKNLFQLSDLFLKFIRKFGYSFPLLFISKPYSIGCRCLLIMHHSHVIKQCRLATISQEILQNKLAPGLRIQRFCLGRKCWTHLYFLQCSNLTVFTHFHKMSSIFNLK